MADLRALCEKAGFADVRTYLASGNALLHSDLGARQVQSTLQTALAKHIGKPIGVLIRTAAEMSAILAANPFSDRAPNRTVVVFLDDAPPSDLLQKISGLQDEELALGTREIYVHYGAGMADSKLRIPAATIGTARNINTVTKLVTLACK